MRRFLFLIALALARASAQKEDDVAVPMTTLSSGTKLPLVGMGVGNLQHEWIEHQVAAAMRPNVKCRLIDTAHASRNEDIVRDGIEDGLAGSKDEVHVVTKVWYTHLGYERTLLSVKESLKALRSKESNIQVHILLHWPRCIDEIPWMECEKEEEALPAHVKEAGPPPHLQKDTAWKASWRALEDLMMGKQKLEDGLPKIASIGVSNFEMDDLKAMATVARTMPAIFQGNVWAYLFDPFLMDFLDKHKIHFQAYNVINGIFGRVRTGPRAEGSLKSIAQAVSSRNHTYTPVQVVLHWLSQEGVSVIPRMASERHLQENSAAEIGGMPPFTERQAERVRNAVASLLRGQDLDPPKAEFVNKHSDRNIDIFWSSEDGKEVPVKDNLKPGENFNTVTFPGHVFVAYDNDKKTRKEFTIQADYGEHEQFHIEL